jgi:photosystem II stability/assembly factor-like uncharacterized protein
MPDVNTTIAVGDLGTIVPSDDGGATWTVQSSGTIRRLNGHLLRGCEHEVGGRHFARVQLRNHSPHHGWRHTWTPQASPTPSGLQGIYFVDASTGTAVGHSGLILHTTDGGATWVAQASGTTEFLSGVSFVDARNGTAVGGKILHTTDGGATWRRQFAPTNNLLWAVSVVDANTATAVGYEIILRTNTGGE